MFKAKVTIGLMAMLSIGVGFSQAGVIFDMGWDGDQLGVQAQDELTIDASGTIGTDAYDGYFDGGKVTGTSMPVILDGVTAGAPSGTNVLDLRSITGGVILHQALSYSTLGDLYGGRTAASPDTPSPYFTLGETEEWTMEFVLNVTQGYNLRGGIMTDVANTTEQWWVRITTAGGLEFMFQDAEGQRCTGAHGSGLNDGQWHHIALTIDRLDDGNDNMTVTSYVDGTFYASTTTAYTGNGVDLVGAGTRDIEIGTFGGRTDRQFNGMMDRIVISDEVLAPGSFVIPEPMTLVLLGLGGAAALRRRY